MKSIEYSSGVEVGGKIELKPEKPKLHPEKLLLILRDYLSKQTSKYNETYKCNWLNSDGSINTVGRPDVEVENERIEEQEKAWASERGKQLNRWKLDEEKDPAKLTEMALTVMMQRLLPDHFMVVRSAAYDDYNNKVDQLIINTKTGKVVCGIDEVINRLGNDGPSIKETKVEQTMNKGGARVKYGPSVSRDKLILEPMKNIPAFYISLDKEELVLLGESISSGEPAEYELALMKKITAFLKKQAETALTWDLDLRLKENVEAFQKSLEEWPA